MRIALFVLLVCVFPGAVSAQDPMWVANRFSADINRVTTCGEVVQTVPLGNNLRSAHVAPDGKIWVVRFIQGTLDLLNPDGTVFGTVPFSLGSAFDVAFDAAGDAWVSGGSGVEQFDPNGVSLGTFPLPAPAPLGITVDADGNKWIAHRTGPPGSISRIDAVTGAVTNHAPPAGSNIQHVRVVADFRGLGASSHIWAVGDSGDTLDEWDANGTPLNSYTIGSGLSSLATDVNGDVWCGSFSTGNVFQVNPATGLPTNVYNVNPNCIGLAFDSFGRLWVSVRVSFSGPQPSELRRLDPLTGNVEVIATVGLGTSSALSTRNHQALVVDPAGDADLDLEQNITEIAVGTSPFDGQSTSQASINVVGQNSVGSTATVAFQAAAGTMSVIAPTTGVLGTPVSFPGITGQMLIDPGTILGAGAGVPVLISVTGSISIPFTVPNAPGTVLYVQALSITLSDTRFSNLACLNVF